jgi:GTP-binding protein YchF
MQIGIVGLPFVGKSTVFAVLSGGKVEVGSVGHGLEPHVAVVKVPDPRAEAIFQLFRSQKLTLAEVEYVDFPGAGFGRKEKGEAAWVGAVRILDALLLVIGAFRGERDPAEELNELHLELLLADLQVIENRLQRLEPQLRAARAGERGAYEREQALLSRIHAALEQGTPARDLDLPRDELAFLRGFQLLSRKPTLVALNLSEAQWPQREQMVNRIAQRYAHQRTRVTALCGLLEREIAQLPPEEAGPFLADLGLQGPSSVRLIQESYAVADLITFFTGNEEETHVWTIPQGTPAVQAAGKIHSDMERGFIRAEVIRWDQLVECGSLAEARHRGLLRHEGRDYVVQDGDVLHILFSR